MFSIKNGRHRKISRTARRFVAVLAAIGMLGGLAVTAIGHAKADSTDGTHAYGEYHTDSRDGSTSWWGTYFVPSGGATYTGGCIDPGKAPPPGSGVAFSPIVVTNAPNLAYVLWKYAPIQDNETGSVLEYMVQSSTELAHSGGSAEFSTLLSSEHSSKYTDMMFDGSQNSGPYKVVITLNGAPTAASPNGTGWVEVQSLLGRDQPISTAGAGLSANPNITVNLAGTGSAMTNVSSVTLTAGSPKVAFNYTVGGSSTTSTALNGTITATSTTAPPTALTILDTGSSSYQRIAVNNPSTQAGSTAASASAAVYRPATPTGYVQIQAVDSSSSSNGLITYAGVYLTDSNGNRVGPLYTTGASGTTASIAVAGGQSFGAKWASVSGSYNMDGPSVPAVVVNAGSTSIYRLSASERGMISVHKKDLQSGAPMSGVGFNVTGSNNNLLASITTDSSGNASTGYLGSGVKVGDTVGVTEYSTPYGYMPTHPSVSMTVVRANPTTPTTVIPNTEQSTVSVHLTDHQTGKGIAGIRFQVQLNGTVYKPPPGTPYSKLTTNAQGNWTYPGWLPLPANSWVTIVQLETPRTYVELGTTQYRNVQTTRTGQGTGLWTIMDDEQGRVSAYKTDLSTGQALTQAVQFVVYNNAVSPPVQLASGYTNRKGYWTSPLLTTTAVGASSIVIQEFKAPAGYSLVTTQKPVVPTRDGTGTGRYSLADPRTFGTASVIKRDLGTNAVIPGVTFTATVSKVGANGSMGSPQAVTGGATSGTESPTGSGNYVTSASGLVTLVGGKTTPAIVFGDKVTFTEAQTAAGYVQPIVAPTVTGFVSPSGGLTLRAFNSPQRTVQITEYDLLSNKQITASSGASYLICYQPASGRKQSTAEMGAATACAVPSGTGLINPSTNSSVNPSTMIGVDTEASNTNGVIPVSKAAQYAQPGDTITIFELSAPFGYVASKNVASALINNTGWANACINTSKGGTGGTGAQISCGFWDQAVPTGTMTKRIVDWGTTTTAAGYVPSGAHYAVTDITTGVPITSDAGPTNSSGYLAVQMPGVLAGDQISFSEITAPVGSILDPTPVIGTALMTSSGVFVNVTQADMTNDPCGSTAWAYKALDRPVVTGMVTPLTPISSAVAAGTAAPVAPRFVLTWPAVGQALTYTVSSRSGNGSTNGLQSYTVSGSAAQPDGNGNVTFSWNGDSTHDGWQSDYIWAVTAQNASSSSPASPPVHLTSQAQAPQNVTAVAMTAAANGGVQSPLNNQVTWTAPASAAGSAAGGYHQAVIAGYTIWEQLADTSWSAIGTAPTGALSFVDLGEPVGSTITYAVTARTALGNGESQATQGLMSAFSATATVTQVAGPVSISATSGSGTTTINWPALASGQSVKIIRGGVIPVTVAVGQITPPYTVSGEPAGADSYYTVLVTNAGGDSIPSNASHVSQAPPVPTPVVCASAANISGQACTGGIPGTNVVAWNFAYDPSYAPTNQLDSRTTVQIYRSLPADVGVASPAVDMSAPILQSTDPTVANYFTPAFFAAATSAITTTLSVLDPNREEGSNYTYAVVACNQDVQTLASQCSAAGTSSVLTQYPAPPTGIDASVQTANSSDQVSWTAAPGATGYNLFESGNLASCIPGNLTSVEQDSLTTAVASDGTTTSASPAAITATSVTGISAPTASCMAFSVQSINATGASNRATIDAIGTPASYAVQYPPVACYNGLSARGGMNNSTITSYMSGSPGTCSTSYQNTRVQIVNQYQRTIDSSQNVGSWVQLAPWFNSTGVDNQPIIYVPDITAWAGQGYQYYTASCSLALDSGAQQCTTNAMPASTGAWVMTKL